MKERRQTPDWVTISKGILNPSPYSRGGGSLKELGMLGLLGSVRPLGESKARIRLYIRSRSGIP